MRSSFLSPFAFLLAVSVATTIATSVSASTALAQNSLSRKSMNKSSMSPPAEQGASIKGSARRSMPAAAMSASSIKIVPTLGVASSDASQESTNGQGLPQGFEQSRRIGFNAGALVEIGRDSLKGQTGLVYYQEGFAGELTQSVRGRSFVSNLDARIEYLGIPLLGKFEMPVGPSSQLYFKGGLVPTILTGARIKAEVQGARSSRVQSGESYDKSGLRDMNLMAQAGIGYQAPLHSNGATDVRVELLFHRGLLNAQTEDNLRLYTSSFMLTAGMGFAL